jgi:hypothetical protein
MLKDPVDPVDEEFVDSWWICRRVVDFYKKYSLCS